jgi:hypothetical protein
VRELFLGQCVDHGAGIAFSAFLLGLAMSSLHLTGDWANAQLGFVFWSGALFVFAAASFFVRSFFVIFFGKTLGALLTGVQPMAHPGELRFWLLQAFESLQIPMPLLWAVEWIWLLRGSPIFGLKFIFVRS